ncbi:ASCH domain-containing protein [Streptomyces sp. NPDC059474]|uniref:ASCH domain-containing protein n=1 Tax=Streptomyces sp. NPDC059474 TaxID=3346846 RepID=UPI003692FBEE
MKALTVHQPWADAIAYGGKRIENRSWTPPAAAVGSTILIHAGKIFDPMGRFVITDWDALGRWPDARGAVIATAVLAGHHRADGCCSPWGEPRGHHWQLTDVQPLTEPVPCRGAQRLWTPTTATIQRIIRTA